MLFLKYSMFTMLLCNNNCFTVQESPDDTALYVNIQWSKKEKNQPAFALMTV